MTRSEKKIYDEADDLVEVFKNQPYYDAEQELERRYKVVVMTFLPLILFRAREILKTTSFFLGFTLGLLIALLQRGA